MALGAIRKLEEEMTRPLDPIHKRYWNKIETHAREVLSDREFETAFLEGQTVSRDDLLDLILKALDGITR